MTRLESLEPGFREKVEELIQKTEEATGRKWIATAGRRTMAEQRAIYAQGRTKPGKVVSNAPAGSSAHNYGLAADLAPMTADGKLIDWNAPREMWQKMADIARGLGLVSGFYFKTIFDAPHVEDPNWKQQQALWKKGELQVA